MRRRAHLASLFFLTTLALVVNGSGCGTIELPDLGVGDPDADPTPLECVPSESESWTPSDCEGIFVSATKGNDDDGDGTPEKPVKSLAKAIALAKAAKKPVYACAEEFIGPVEVPEGITLFGGLECDAGWLWVGDQNKTTLTAPAGEIPLRMTATPDGDTIRLTDIHVVAKPIPQDGTAEPGTSSIAAVAASVGQINLKRCRFEAGDAASGLDGEPYGTLAKNGADGNPGQDACSDSSVDGGEPQINDCGTPEDTDDSIGGSGGAGRSGNGDPGQSGYPGTVMNGGNGQAVTTTCAPGAAGESGIDGDPGNGATDDGGITPEGYVGASGAPGAPGITAQGGGGGGGSRGVPTASTTPPRSCPDGAPPLGGASGGSGGAGGCGGAGGKGGGPGGASIALISINSGLSFEDVTLKTGNGGKGGDGGPGQDGGMGGTGGLHGKVPAGSSNLLDACDGGKGGKGGKGGQGGGGAGGHSIGIAFQGVPPTLQGVTFELGDPGEGGVGSGANHGGEPGEQTDTLEF